MSAELVAHRGQQLVANSLAPRELKRWKSDALSTGAGTPSSIAASMVQRPSPESDTAPAELLQLGIGEQRAGGEVEQPRSDDAAAAPYFGDFGEV